MAYLVLALGALLSIGGALSIFQGAGIVQVERGWTGVIAGATSLTGGIITIALGLILKALLDLRARGLSSAPQHLASDVEPRPVGLSAAETAAVPAPASELESGLIAAFLAPEPVTAATPVARGTAVDQAELEHHAPVAEPLPVVREMTVPERVPQEQIAAEQPEPPKPRFKISFNTPAEPHPPVEPLPAVESHPPVPAMDDWLDRAFSSLDNEPSPGAGEPPPHPSPREAAVAASEAEMAVGSLPHASHEYTDVVAELEPAPPQPLTPPEPAAPAAPPPAQSAVIGRYEADGTSYVMFADGSIEAQSEAGVYRFTSMTELKAFIEGTG